MLKQAIVAVGALAAALVGASASAQLNLAADNPVVYGHHHMNVSDTAEQRKVWVDLFGGELTSFGANEVVVLPNVLIFMRSQAPTGGTKGTTVNHIGFSVPDLPHMLSRAEAAGIPVVTGAEVPATMNVVDGIADVPAAGLRIAFIMAPDDIKIEIVEDTAQPVPVDLHHVHFAAAEPVAVRDWYVDTFGGRAGRLVNFETAELPGVTLSFLPTTESLAGTEGRSLDHIGFEIDGLAEFVQKLESRGIRFDRPYREIPERGIALAFFTDPWGTYIELTEGLDDL